MSPHAPHVPSAHTSAGPKTAKAPPPPPPLTAAQKAKIERENELWKTEQAMKAKLDASDEAKGNRLWQQTISVVHKHDPNAALIAKLNKEDMLSGPHAAPAAKHARGAGGTRSAAKPATAAKTKAAGSPAPPPAADEDADMKEQLKAQLSKSVASKLHESYHAIKKTEQTQLAKIAHHNTLASTAQAHAHLSLTDMKSNLKKRLDSQTNQKLNPKKTKADTAADKQAHESTSEQLQNRLKAELDDKTKAAQKKMLQAETARKRLRIKRKKLAGNLKRALKVRQQLTREMKEQNTIRSQLDKQAAQKGKQMLAKKTGDAAAGKTAPHKLTKHELMAEMRATLRKEEAHKMTQHAASAHDDAKAPVSLKKLSAQPHMEQYLRKQVSPQP